MKKFYLLSFYLLTLQSLFAQQLISKPDLVMPNHTDDVTSLAYAPYSKLIASGSWDNSINIYSDDGKYIRSIRKHTAAVEALCFSRDGKYLFSGSNDFSAYRYDVASGNVLNSFSGHTANVTAVAVDAANKFFFTGSDDGSVKLWDLSQNGSLFKTIVIGFEVHSLTIAGDGLSFFVGGNAKDLMQYDMGGKLIKKFSGHTDFINASAISLNGKIIVTASNDKSLILWDAKAGTKIKELTGHQLKVNAAIFSFDSKYVISGSNDGTCGVWSVETGKEIFILNDNMDNKIRAVLIGFDKKKVYTAAKMKNQADWGVRMWSLPMDSIEKNAVKTIIGGPSKDDKNTGLSNAEDRAKQNPANKKEADKSNPSGSNTVNKTTPGTQLETVDSAKMTLIPDTEAIRRSGKQMPKGSKTLPPKPEVKPNPAAKTANEPVKSAIDKTAVETKPNPVVENPAKPAPPKIVNTIPGTKADKIRKAQQEKEQKEKEERDRIEKEKQVREKQIQDSTNAAEEEAAKPKSRFKKLR